VAGYEILGELGRGGMGVVYKARQIGLNRLVALKMVLAGGHASAEHLARFHTEAEAVARLQHTNIVQIFEVGDQAGLPYFSLEFVDGGSLAEKIGRKPLPPREGAALVEQLARAMDFAHQHGIVHRDLKPMNVLMTRSGLPKITDFGLAKRLEGDSSQTRSGTLMGTPSYMAPEQARGEVHEIGPSADLYALGAILYECLTGRPPFVGATMLDTLEQVRSREPLPPSGLQPSVPRDLETICLKCLQKEPGKRYGACQELADDLHHFLAGEPIRARPVGSLERFWRWCRRNPRIAAMTATIFLLLVAGVVISSLSAVTIARERNQKEAERQAAEEARDVANEQVALAIDTVKTLIHKVQDQLKDVPRSQEVKMGLLQTAAEGLEKITQRAKGSNSSEVAFSIAAVHMRMGFVYRQLGETEKAFKHVEASHQINVEQVQELPDSDRAKSNLASSYSVLADMSLELRRDLATSLDYYQRALRLREALFRHPHDTVDAEKRKRAKEAYADTAALVGTTLLIRMGEPAGARKYFQTSLELREELVRDYPQDKGDLLALAYSYRAVGEACFRLHETEPGRQYFDKCLKIREQLSQDNPENPQLKVELAKWCEVLGEKDQQAEDLPDARKHFQRSVDLYRELATLDPKNADYQQRLGIAYYEIATVCHLAEDEAAAEEHFRACRRIRQALADADPKNMRRQMELMGVLPHCGEPARAAEIAVKLRQSKPKDQEILLAVACCYASCAADPALQQEYTRKAIDTLQDLVGLDFKDVFTLETDPDLAPVRNDPAFCALLAKLQKR
jgi:serine/threonine-protein kinase